MSKRRRAEPVELMKDILILLLTCTALYLAAQTPLAAPLLDLFREEGPQAAPGMAQGVERESGAVPLAMVVNLPGRTDLPGQAGGPEGVRHGIQYDQSACQELFQRVAGPLVEALSSAGAPERITRREWEETLTGALGVYLDFQGEIPFPVLSGWLSGGGTGLTATVRRLVLTVGADGVELYYRDAEDGGYYRSRDQVADPYSLAEALSGLTDNGAFYAFESELYQDLDPDTLLLPEAPAPAVYTASTPMNAGRGSLQSLVQDLGFSLNSTSFYSTDEQVARSGDDSVRLSDRGVLLYTAGEDSGRYPVADREGGGALTESVEACRQLAAAALLPRCGEARLYLISALPVPGGWDIDFGYSLNGLPVHLDGGSAASFQVRDGAVVQFVLRFRAYASAGAPSLVLPPRQAAAALAAKGLAGEELLLTYTDAGGDILSAGWSARDSGAGEG